MADVPTGPARLQAVRDELVRVQEELDEMVSIRMEAEAAKDPDIVAECKAAEERLRGLVAELEAEAGRLQKPSGAEALRARLEKIRQSEARARSVLGSRDLDSPGVGNGQTPNISPRGSAASDFPTSAIKPPIGARTPAGKASSPTASTQVEYPKSPSQSRELEVSDFMADTAPAAGDSKPADDSGFGASAFGAPAFGVARGQAGRPTDAGNRKKLDDVVQANTAMPGKKLSELSLENHAASSLDSFADSGFGGPSSVKSAGSALPGKGPSPASTSPETFGFGESAFRAEGGSGEAGKQQSPTEPSFGFGESAFSQPAGASAHSQQLGLEQGPNLSLRDSFPTTGGGNAPGGATWQAFSVPPTQPEKPAGNSSRTVSWELKDDLRASGSGASAFSASGGAFPSQPASHAPSPSARSGNPFQDFGEAPAPTSAYPSFDAPPSHAGGAPELSHAFSGLGFDAAPKAQQAPSPPRTQAPAPADFNSFEAFPDPFASRGPAPPASQGGFGTSPAASGFSDYDPFAPTAAPGQGAQGGGFPGAFGAAAAAPGAAPILPGSHPVPQRGAQVGGGSFGAFPGSKPSDQSFVVTPSMVIPDADWEAAFASPNSPPQASKAAGVAQNAEPQEDDSLWVPMTANDRSRCEDAYKNKYGGQELGLGAARELYGRVAISDPLESIFALADMDGNGSLSFPEFLLFMYLLKVLRKGVTLPKHLSHERISYLLGADLSTLGSAGPGNAAASAQPPSPQPSAPLTSNLDILIAGGASEEDAKRALFLNGDELEAAKTWLEGQKSGGSSVVPGHLTAGTKSPTAALSDSGPSGPRLSIKIEKALLVYKKTLDRPIFQVSLRDAYGEPLEEVVETPPCQYSNGVFQAGHSAVPKTPVGKMPEGTVVYFELKHWKTKEKKWSTLGWTYMPKERFIKLVDGEPTVRTEAQGMHMYAKPLDFQAHFRQASMRKLKPLGEVPDLFLRFSQAG